MNVLNQLLNSIVYLLREIARYGGQSMTEEINCAAQAIYMLEIVLFFNKQRLQPLNNTSVHRFCETTTTTTLR